MSKGKLTRYKTGLNLNLTLISLKIFSLGLQVRVTNVKNTHQTVPYWHLQVGNTYKVYIGHQGWSDIGIITKRINHSNGSIWYYKSWQVLLQIETARLLKKRTNFSTKCGSHYKTGQLYYQIRKLLQKRALITKRAITKLTWNQFSV